MTRPVDPKDLRVSDAERSHVLGLLEKATGRGLIDIHEYTSRSAAVIAARTRGDLNAVLVDLPGLQIAGHTVDEARSVTAAPPPGPGYSGAVSPVESGPGMQVLDLSGWGGRSFKGSWVVPPLIVIAGTGASTRLDFTQATLSSRLVTIEFRSNYGGATDLIVPAGTPVRMDQLQMRGGQLNNKLKPGRSDGRLQLELTGVKKYGSITIRSPRR